ncbi:hypothetical protein ACEYXF_44535, partial [Streptomyces asiaticus]|uniref:hypothetical protein n=1 Tax=Streptomyces asiaticus TaxID=114695 RepID=UPI0039BEABBA
MTHAPEEWGGGAQNVDVPSLDLHDEEDVETPEEDGVHVHEIASQKRVGLGSSAAAGATPRRIRLPATGTEAHSHPGSTGHGHGERRIARKHPGEHP